MKDRSHVSTTYNKSGEGEAGAGRPRLLIVVSSLRLGGTERQIALLAPELVRRGWRVTVYGLSDGAVLHEHLARNGVAVVVNPAGSGLLHTSKFVRGGSVLVAAFHLFAIMARLRPAVAHFFLPAAYLIGAPCAVLLRVPVRVMSRRSLNFYQKHWFFRAVERRMHRFMQAVVGNSRSVVAQLREEGVAPDRVGLIYNGIDAGRVAAPASRAQVRGELGLAPEALVLCIVANLIPYKGHRDLIDALALAKNGLPAGWQMLVVGRDDGAGQALRQRTAELGLQDQVVFLGERNDTADVLAASDIGILCSHEEGFSNAILEGMAARLPMVVSDAGGNAEAVLDGRTGLVVPVRDPERLAAAIVRLAGDPKLRDTFGEAGQRRVLENFSLQRFADAHQALYAALRAGRPVNEVPNVRVAE